MHSSRPTSITRRGLVRTAATASALFAVPGLFAEQLEHTPDLGEGPFYPDKMPLDTDNDLLVIHDATTPAAGEITHLTGRILTSSGQPVRNATVEIWQVDAHGVYIHTRAPGQDRRDTNFQGFGRFETGSSGEYRFRTIKPTPYHFGGRRAPHIHFAVDRKGRRVVTTQLFLKGFPGNERDSVIQGGRRDRNLASLFVDFNPAPGSKIGELAATFDIVIDGEPLAGVYEPAR